MKKIITVILALLVLTSCSSPNGADHTSDIIADKKSKTTTTGSGSLTLWITNGWHGQDTYTKAVSEYETLYPEVDVKVEYLEFNNFDSYEDYQTDCRTKILAGNGPDVLFDSTGDNVYKEFDSGRYCDLTPFLEADTDYNPDNYYNDVIKGSSFDGKQYIMPMSFEPYFLQSSENAIKKSEIDLSKCGTMQGFAGEMQGFYDRNAGKTEPRLFHYIPTLYRYSQWMGLSDIISYDKQTVNIDTPEMRAILETYKAIYENEIPAPDNYRVEDTASNIAYEKFVFDTEITAGLFNNLFRINYESEPVVFCPRTIKGEIGVGVNNSMGINVSCENKQNAYNFIKLMMSPSMQKRIMEDNTSHAILKSAVSDFVRNEQKYMRVENHTLVKGFGGEYYERVEGKYGDESNYGNNGRTLKDLKVKNLPDSFYDDYLKMLDEPKKPVIFFADSQEFSEYFMPYFEGKSTLDKCMKLAQQKFEIIISE